jgi:ubiquinone/menaquinone biosynthesis C-methylase UbiE
VTAPDTPEGNGDHWDQYWAAGALTSLPEDFEANYDGEIRDFWRTVFDGVPDGARVLDVCTGNGAVAVLAAERLAGRQPPVSIQAVDAADIRPEAVKERYPQQARWIDAIEFIGRTRFERLEAPDRSFDLITSQYGIEYCDLDRAATRAHALLNPGGRLAFLSHALSSDMLRTMESEYRDYRRIEQLQVVSRLEAHLRGEIDADVLRRSLARARAELVGQPRLLERPLNRMVLGMVEQTLSMSDADVRAARPRYEGFTRQLVSGRDRLGDMLRVHRMMRDDPDWTRCFERAGLEPRDSGRVRYLGRHDVGRYHIFERA